MEEKFRLESERARHELTAGDVEARQEVAERYRKDAESARREAKRLEKARTNVEQRRGNL